MKIIDFDEACLKAASYDITPSAIAMSSKIGMLETVYREKSYIKDKYYIYAHPKDTVLIVSNEYIEMPGNIAGYVSSRVSKVVEGFGHISTTIDPDWSGAVLIAVSNPTAYPLKIYVGKGCHPESDPNSLATVTFHYLNTPIDDDETDKKEAAAGHKSMRLDLLQKVSYENRKWGIRTWVRWCIHPFRRKYTDYFLAASRVLEKNFTENRWRKFIAEFSEIANEQPQNIECASAKAKKRAGDFFVTERWYIRFYYFYREHYSLVIIIRGLLIIGALIVFIILCPEKLKETLSEALDLLRGLGLSDLLFRR